MKLTNKTLIPAAVFFICIMIILTYLMQTGSAGGAIVRIKKGTEIIEEVNIDAIEDVRSIDLGTNRVHIDKDGACMESATCPDKLCVKQGKIDKEGQSVICLPNKIIVEIVGATPDVDAVAGAR